MKKILCVNVSDRGSTGKIIEDIARNSEEYKFVLCVPHVSNKSQVMKAYSLMRIPHEQGIYRRIAKIKGYPFGFAPFSTMRLERIIRYEKPDLVHIHCVNMNMVNIYKLFHFLAISNIPFVVTNHAEFYYTGSCAHAKECVQWENGCKKCTDLNYATGTLWDRTNRAWDKMKKAFEEFEKITVVSVSPWVAERCKKSGIMKNVTQDMILNGINTEIFYPKNISNLRKTLKISNKKVILHVTAGFTNEASDLKGGIFFLKLAKRFQNYDNMLFVVAGSVARDLEKYNFPKNLLLLGNVSDQERLADWYSIASLTIITSKRETFSLPVAESLCCGTPVIGFEAGGPESIALEEFSEFVSYGDENALKKAFEKWNSIKNAEVEKKCAICAKEKYDSKLMSHKYEEIYRKMI